MPETTQKVTDLLNRWWLGDRVTKNELFELLLAKLRRSHYFRKRDRSSRPLYLKLV
jgi:hypothetical protein